MSTDLHHLTIAKAAGLLRTRKLSPVEYVDALIARAERLDSEVHAYITRPFDESTVLRVGHAYEKATAWRDRRPALGPDTRAPLVAPPPLLAGTAKDADAETREACARAAARAGLKLDGILFEQLLEGAPYALAMAKRLRRDHGFTDEPGNVFSFPPL